MSETSEYIMGQVRSMQIINRQTTEHLRTGNIAQARSLVLQQEQELHFLYKMLAKHPPHMLEHKPQ